MMSHHEQSDTIIFSITLSDSIDVIDIVDDKVQAILEKEKLISWKY